MGRSILRGVVLSFTFSLLTSFCFFFFSSRRRHTRLQGDWSSDVCSSDLGIDLPSDFFWVDFHHWIALSTTAGGRSIPASWQARSPSAAYCEFDWSLGLRSEERRVGKECRSRWSPYH